MTKLRARNKQNAVLNGEWGRVKGTWKRITSKKRRAVLTVDLLKRLKE